MEWTEIVNCIGGIGGVIAGLSAWLANIWANRILQNEKATQNKQLELLKTSLESIKEHNTKFTSAQFDSYNTLWCALVDLKIHAEKLWREITFEEMIAFNKSLSKASELIQKSRIFLGDRDYQDFLEIACAFESYQAGKSKLVFIQTEHALEEAVGSQEQLRRQIEEQTGVNSRFRREYRTILDRIADSLKKQLGLKRPQD